MPELNKSLEEALLVESQKFREAYLWLLEAMPSIFFKETPPENCVLIAHNLMGLPLQGYFSTINLEGAAIVLTLDTPEADLKILESYATKGIKDYQAYISKIPPPFKGIEEKLRIATILFTEYEETKIEPLSEEEERIYHQKALEVVPGLSLQEFKNVMNDFGPRFLRAISLVKFSKAVQVFLKAKHSDKCECIIDLKEDWRKENKPSMYMAVGWKNTPTHHFLYRLARVIYRHNLVIKRMVATQIHPYQRESLLIMMLDLHGKHNLDVQEETSLPEFLREFTTVKYFASFDAFDKKFVTPGLIPGNMANFLRAWTDLIHQSLLHIDPNFYSLDQIEEGLCRHPDLTLLLVEAFQAKFHPLNADLLHFQSLKDHFLGVVEKLDTGQEENDQKCRTILKLAMLMVEYTLKTNAFLPNFTALSFRLDPLYLEALPFDRTKKFPELPYAIFFIKGMHHFGFHIRFKDLSRGGLRTILPKERETMIVERNRVFTECYQLALTQHRKNKDIPEGGAKGVIFLKPYAHLNSEAEVYREELFRMQIKAEEIDRKIAIFKAEQTLEHLYQAQRAYVENLLVLVNAEEKGRLKQPEIIDYYGKPEYLYLGPDENMHDSMIQWMADKSREIEYKPGSAFISGKPREGINHKEYGVTSLGVNIFMEECLKNLKIDPVKDPFTVKMVGGPDGDVAGNQILNLFKYYPKTARLLALVDVSGAIYDPEGLDFTTLSSLFKEGKPIRNYPPRLLHEGGWLIDKSSLQETSPTASHTLCTRKIQGELKQEWLSGSEVQHYQRTHLFQTKTDVFIPAGGRPRSLNENNYKEFLDESGKPSSKIIIEGANLYLTPQASRELEKAGAYLIKDSSANKTGVISSSFEVLCGLALGDALFYEEKEQLVSEILERLASLARSEALLLLSEHDINGGYFTDISVKISERINLFTDQLLEHLGGVALGSDPMTPLNQCFLHYALPTLKKKYTRQLMQNIPDPHKKAIIACHVGASLVYKKGLHWFPSVVDVLPLVLNELFNI